MSKHATDDDHEQPEKEDITVADAEVQAAADNPDSTEGMGEADDATNYDPLLKEDENDPLMSDAPKPRITAVPAAERKTTPQGNWFKRFVTNKKLSIPSGIILLLIVLLAVPFTRFVIAGLFLKQSYSVAVVDAASKQPVTSATVSLGGQTVETDSKGKATLKVAVGSKKLEVSKKYYTSTSLSVTVPLLKQKDIPKVSLKATGRQIPITLTNIISKKPVADVTITAGESEAKTDVKGQATLVVPADKKQVEVMFTGKGYNTKTETIPVEAQYIKAPEYTVTPVGKLYFLSNASGKLDVVKTNLDGSARQVVLAGTGKEAGPQTSLLASRDWKYLALHAKRDSDKPKLYLIDTATDKLTTMDEGDATFEPTGWSGSRFVYRVTRNKQQWEPKREALKTYDAANLKLATLDESAASGSQGTSAAENFDSPYILDNEIVYVKRWTWEGAIGNLESKNHTLNSVKADGSAKRTVKSYPAVTVPGYYYNPLTARLYEPQEVYILAEKGDATYQNKEYTVEEYESGQIKLATGITKEAFYNEEYPTYLISPSGQRSFWTKIIDGALVFSIGDKEGGNAKQIGVLADYNQYGWYSDDYILFSKKGSELYIAPAAPFADQKDLLKVSNYYRAASLYGYGYGYGGL